MIDVITAKPGPGGRIWLMATDGSASSKVALEYAVTLLQPQDVLEIFQAVPMVKNALGTIAIDIQQIRMKLHSEAQELLAAASKSVVAVRVDVAYCEDARMGILDKITRSGASILVVGSRGNGPLKQLFVGSTSLFMLHNSPIPVLLAK